MLVWRCVIWIVMILQLILIVTSCYSIMAGEYVGFYLGIVIINSFFTYGSIYLLFD